VLKLTCAENDRGNTGAHHRQRQPGSHAAAAEGGPIRKWPARSPKPAMANAGYAGLKETDLAAIINYLRTVPPLP
jgi:hypothetical protein